MQLFKTIPLKGSKYVCNNRRLHLPEYLRFYTDANAEQIRYHAGEHKQMPQNCSINTFLKPNLHKSAHTDSNLGD